MDIFDSIGAELEAKFPRVKTMSKAQLRKDREINEWMEKRLIEGNVIKDMARRMGVSLMFTCKHCGARTPDADKVKFCPSCGRPA